MHDAAAYRERIYRAYVTARAEPLAPSSLIGLRPRLPYLKRLIGRHIPRDPNAVIFDLGCGHGALLYALKLEGYTNATGVDASREQIEAARKLNIDGVSQGDLMAAIQSMPDESLDVLIAFDLIEHLTKGELLSLVDEAYRVLRPGGRWIIHTPNGEGPFAGRMRYWDFTHEVAFTRTSLAQLLISSGFGEVNCYEDRPVIHGMKSLVRAIIWRVIRLLMMLYVAAEMGDTDRGAVFSQNLLAVAWKTARARELRA